MPTAKVHHHTQETPIKQQRECGTWCFRFAVHVDLHNGMGRLYLDVGLEFALEACKEDLALAGFEAVKHAGDRALQIGAAEEDELAVDKVLVADLVGRVIQEGAWNKGTQPCLALLDLLLGECQLQGGAVTLTCPCILVTPTHM